MREWRRWGRHTRNFISIVVVMTTKVQMFWVAFRIRCADAEPEPEPENVQPDADAEATVDQSL